MGIYLSGLVIFGSAVLLVVLLWDFLKIVPVTNTIFELHTTLGLSLLYYLFTAKSAGTVGSKKSETASKKNLNVALF